MNCRHPSSRAPLPLPHPMHASASAAEGAWVTRAERARLLREQAARNAQTRRANKLAASTASRRIVRTIHEGTAQCALDLARARLLVLPAWIAAIGQSHTIFWVGAIVVCSACGGERKSGV